MTNWINAKESNYLSLDDRGFNYGDGLFETIAVEQQQLLNFENHYQRLQKGCERLKFAIPDYAELLAQINSFLENHNTEQRIILKLIITRGESQRGYNICNNSSQTLILRSLKWPNFKQNYYQQGINIVLSEVKLAQQPLLAGIKHLNRLEQVLASASLAQEYDEALMLDTKNNVISAIAGNLLWCKGNTIFTPLLNKSGVEGTMLKQIESFCQQNQVSLEQADYLIEDLLDAQELLLCNSIRGVWPVKSLFYQQQRFNYSSSIGEFYQQLSCFNRQLGHIK